MTASPTDPPLALHGLLTGRGWHLDGERDPGDPAFPGDPRCGWHYPATFGGQPITEIDFVTPARLQCYFTFDREGDEVLGILPAGNKRRNGCPEHDTDERFFRYAADGSLDLGRIAAELDAFEPRARELDPRAVVECLFFGPCAAAVSSNGVRV
ncbi:hypothetical protein QRX60_32175 [Amycolatopsis mongoliensis]|uniref:Uncharacterized protein n=1 Tax=Amycolatopsis mongoliensis TaxID=715475 RepID=A0A9Y2JHR7_9PSEU|nr:hypothetical protein [Amycolatopsis sp. 4-36]WIX98707.1 hypothetical protein QRX60_32175 [Amycolatopsis sp. 4-36]